MNRIKKYMLFLATTFVVVSSLAFGENDYENLLNSTEWKDMVSKGTVYLETGMYEKALEYFKNIAVNYPYIPEAQYYLGYVYFKDQDLPNAQKIFKRALKLDPEYVPALYYLALISYNKGENKRAIELFNEVTKYDPYFQSAYYNKAVAYMEMEKPIDAMREFAYAVYLEPTDENAIEALVRLYSMMKKGQIVHTVDPAKKRGALKADDTKGKNKVITEEIPPDDEIFYDILVSNPGEEAVTLREGEEIDLIAGSGKSGILEVVFPEPQDLSGKYIVFKIKGNTGKESLRVNIKDSFTRSCPKFNIKSGNSSWVEEKIDIRRTAGMYIDIKSVKKITFELLTVKDKSEIEAKIKDFAIKTI